MSVRRVEIRLSATDDGARPTLDDIQARLDKIAKSNPTIKINIDNATSASLDKLSAKLDKLGDKVAKPKVEVNGLDKANADLDKFEAKLDKLDKKRVAVSVKTNIDSKEIRKNVDDTLRGLKDSLEKMFGGGGGGGGVEREVENAAEGGGGSGGGSLGKDALSTLGGANNYLLGGSIAGLVALAMSMAPAIIPAALGGGIGGLGAYAALALGSHAKSTISADQMAYEKALAALSGKNNNTASNRLSLAEAKMALGNARSQYGSFLPLGNDVSKIGKSGLSSLLTALNFRPTNIKTSEKLPSFITRGGPGADLLSVTRGPSFLQELHPILNQVGGFVQKSGPALGGMFQASAPILNMFVKSLETLATLLMPAFTQSMKELKPYLPIIQQGFTELSQGVADFIKDLGPGMKDGAIVFKAVMIAVKGILIGIAYTSDFLAKDFVKIGEAAKDVAHDSRDWFDKMRAWVSQQFDTTRHNVVADWDAMWDNTAGRMIRGIGDVHKWLDTMRHDISTEYGDIGHDIDQAWDTTWNNTVGRAIRGGEDVDRGLEVLRHDIANAFDGIRHDIAADWDSVWTNTLTTVGRGINAVVNWFKRLPGYVYGALRSLGNGLDSIGATAIGDLWSGMKHGALAIFSWAEHTLGGGLLGILKKVWSIASPSKAMYGLGANLMLGLEHGIQSRFSKLASNVKGIGGNVVSWISEALKITHKPASWLRPLEMLVSKESGGNSRAYDPISVGGQHAQGLFQTLPSTFSEYSLGGSIDNPIADAVAGIRYLSSRYGSPYAIPGLLSGDYHGYAKGGWVNEPVLGVGMHSGSAYGFAETRPEYVGQGGGTTIIVNGALDPKSVAQQIVKILNRNTMSHGGKSGLIINGRSV